MTFQVRDPVHSFISLREKERQLVDTPLLQRLRGIRQLAMASIVYPGALHTRFDHTLGVMHLADQMAKALELGEDDAKTVRFAAILHDIGHGPFSHVSEYALERYADRSTLKSGQKKEKIHELVTGLMITTDPAVGDIIGKRTCQKVARLLAAGHGERVLRQIISGPLDADKQDYLLRDSYFCGVPYGVFDPHQLHRSISRVRQPENSDHELMIRPDGIHAVEQYVLAKYYLTTNVYRHKVRLITDQMIVRAIVLGIERDRIEELKALYAFDNSSAFAERYAAWDDARFLQAFGRGGVEGKCKAMLERLAQRRLLKRVFAGRPSDFREEVREQLLTLVRQHADSAKQAKRNELRQRVEASIADVLARAFDCEVGSDFVIYHAYDIKSVKEMSRNDEAPILVDRPGGPRRFEDESVLFTSIGEGFNEEFVETYAPVAWDTPADRGRFCNQVRGKIIEAIEKQLMPVAEGATK